MEQASEENEQDRIAIANRAEELMLRTRQVARRMKDRLWQAMKPEPLAGPHARPPQGILVAEDDATIRDLLQLMLERLGFQVWLAADGLEAVDLYRRHQDAIGAVVLDVYMPRLDGPGTLQALRAINPRLGCVFISGDPGGCAEAQVRATGPTAVLQKPFLPEQLGAALRPLLCLAGVSPSSRPDS